MNGRKWSLLYQGSRDGFEATDFHSHCDYKRNTLTIVKSTSGNIFGGFTNAQWNPNEPRQFGNIAFIFSLVNKENKPLLFEKTSNDRNCSIYSLNQRGPIFGGGYDIYISDSSNTNSSSYSNLGFSYTHPEYTNGSDRTKTILAGTHSFQVEEIEVFQMQQ